MAAAIERELGVTAELVDGDDGVFDVAVDGSVVFSRKERGGEFAAVGEVVDLVRSALAS